MNFGGDRTPYSIPSRLILNLFDSSTDERLIKTNNEIKIAIESTEERM